MGDCKRDVLKNEVVELVKRFIENEGGITIKDIRTLFGSGSLVDDSIAAALESLVISFPAVSRSLDCLECRST